MEDSLTTTIAGWLSDARDVVAGLCANSALTTTIAAVAQRAATAIDGGGKLLFAGNGGSAADALHFAAELVGRYAYERPGLPAVALTADPAILTAVANDYAFEHVFARQIEAIAIPGDVLVAISTSGRSANILAALRTARTRGIITVGLTGRAGAATMADRCDYILAVPSDETPRIQEAHKIVGHVLCGLIEQIRCPQGAAIARLVGRG